MKLNRKGIALFCCLALVLLFCDAPLLVAEAEPKVGQVLGLVKFAMPTDEDAKYLGLDKSAEFTLRDVKAPYVLVEQFNTSCPHSMHQAPALNNLYSLVQQNPALKCKLKFMCVGQGNDETEVKMWKASLRVPFPVLPDPNYSLGKALNFTPYPVTMLMDRSGKILWVSIGAFENAVTALQDIKIATATAGPLSDQLLDINLYKSNDYNKIKALLDQGANVNGMDKYGSTALIFACVSGSTPDIVKLLIDRGADVNAKDKSGMTALDFASNEVVKRILNSAAAKVGDGSTASAAAKKVVEESDEERVYERAAKSSVKPKSAPRRRQPETVPPPPVLPPGGALY